MTYCDPLVDEGSRRCFELNVHICVGCSVRGGGAMCASSEDGVTALGRLQPAQLGRQDEVICDVCPAVRTVVCGVENEVNFFCGECIQKKSSRQNPRQNPRQKSTAKSIGGAPRKGPVKNSVKNEVKNEVNFFSGESIPVSYTHLTLPTSV